jgi:hypothetical protein
LSSSLRTIQQSEETISSGLFQEFQTRKSTHRTEFCTDANRDAVEYPDAHLLTATISNGRSTSTGGDTPSIA